MNTSSMRKTTVFWVALLALGMWGQAQTFSGIGLKYGFNYGTPISKPVPGATATPGLASLAGAFTRIQFHPLMDVQIEMLLSTKSNEFSTPISGDTIVMQYIPNVGFLPFPADYSGTVTGRFRNIYLEVPVLLRASYWDDWSFLLGGYTAFLLHGDNSGTADIVLGNNFDTREGEPFDQTQYLNPLDYGVVIGGEYRSREWLFDVRATIGLRSVYQNDYAQVSNSVWNGYLQASLGYFFFHKSN